VIDRVLQQAISQVLTPIFEKPFSDNSFGFRPGRNAHDAIRTRLYGLIFIIKHSKHLFHPYISMISMLFRQTTFIPPG